jgi:hypothetical protein
MLLLHHVKSTWSVSNKHEATIQKFDDDKIFRANSCLWPVVLITTLCDKFINNLKSPGFLQVTLFSYNKIEILLHFDTN